MNGNKKCCLGFRNVAYDIEEVGGEVEGDFADILANFCLFMSIGGKRRFQVYVCMDPHLLDFTEK